MTYPQITRSIKEFKCYEPKLIDEAVSLLGEGEGKLVLLAGGTDLLRMMRLRAITPDYVLNLKGIPGLDQVQEKGGLRIGALTRIASLEKSPLIKETYLPVYEAAKTFAIPQIRNMATVGGNICRSSPSADMVPPLMALGGMLTLVGPKGERKVALEDFFTGPGENILEKEILTEIAVPPLDKTEGAAFGKITRNSGDLAKVNGAVKVAMDHDVCRDITIVLGAVADRPVRARSVESILKGNKITASILEEATSKIDEDITPITDVRSTKFYRMHVSKIMTRRLIQIAVKRVKEQ